MVSATSCLHLLELSRTLMPFSDLSNPLRQRLPAMTRLFSIKLLMRLLHRPIYAKRLSVLVAEITSFVAEGDRLLDVGCGSGKLGYAILHSALCPKNVKVIGLESHRRGEEAIEVREYDGEVFPFADGAFDVVILADVLHHEQHQEKLVSESIRVARRLVIIKDHKVDGILAHARIALIDWAANVGYGVKCLYVYKSLEEWRRFLRQFPVTMRKEATSMNLYPAFINLLFGRRLHYLAVLEVSGKKGV
jgi:SAM-dependent methyltransferase